MSTLHAKRHKTSYQLLVGAAGIAAVGEDHVVVTQSFLPQPFDFGMLLFQEPLKVLIRARLVEYGDVLRLEYDIPLQRLRGTGKALSLAIEFSVTTSVAAWRERCDAFPEPLHADLDDKLFKFALAKFVKAVIAAHI
ncbi:hypothetical protein AAV28_33715 [Bradyrhizobium diazoefficiens USDA 110]|nr:hypothetical protein AAV28_33715 [Bradyrhizobium diazoefficiens USDA 110]BCF47215.1 hypothetical protein XF16B_77050 [Bradyrhizobium diazoefficiens]